LKVSIHQALARLPAGRTDTYPGGASFVRMLAGETMSVEVFAPKGADLQQSHAQDGLYFIHSGTAHIIINQQRFDAAPGDAFFVAAGVAHKFENFSSDFATWVVFNGPLGGEQ
jgi:mannose-6-phosphate isomerase-like protein (cupin superfamily)